MMVLGPIREVLTFGYCCKISVTGFQLIANLACNFQEGKTIYKSLCSAFKVNISVYFFSFSDLASWLSLFIWTEMITRTSVKEYMLLWGKWFASSCLCTSTICVKLVSSIVAAYLVPYRVMWHWSCPAVLYLNKKANSRRITVCCLLYSHRLDTSILMHTKVMKEKRKRSELAHAAQNRVRSFRFQFIVS